MPTIQAADPQSKPCKICQAAAPLYGVVDFHKSCLEQKGFELNKSGIPIYYRRCSECHFVFTDALDDWSAEDFKSRIYNADYEKIDPDYKDNRPAMDAVLVDKLFAAEKSNLRLLDYGGGNGKLAALLREKGYDAQTFDPFSEHSVRPAIRADVITCFEVFEHTTDPLGTLDDLLTFLNPNGLIVSSTLLQLPDFDDYGLRWWYVAPRNGHVSIHSTASLKKLFELRGLAVISPDNKTHIAKPVSAKTDVISNR